MTGPIRNFDETDRLYRRALETIPTASQTFSKSAVNYVKGASPLFAARGKGAELWDVDGNRYVDYVMGLLPAILGYCDEDVDAAVIAQLKRGITLSLATSLEVELAERLRALIPCAEMARFGKNGSDATSAAVRIARAVTGRDKILVCGYHGWQDWYIGSTTRHLGVPEVVRNLTIAFPYNDIGALERVLDENRGQVAAIILEPMTLTPPETGYLSAVRELASRCGALLIFDEIITGFRIDLGGAQRTFGVVPDLASFGKSMGNGLPISAVVGRREYMRYMDDIFFSGTFGGETLSLAASLATIAKLERLDGPGQIASLGARIAAEVRKLVVEAGLHGTFKLVGGDWWPGIIANPDSNHDPVLLNSLLRQELIANGVLMGATFNLSLAHAETRIIDETICAFANALRQVAVALDNPDPWRSLRGEPIRPVFAVRAAPNGKRP